MATEFDVAKYILVLLGEISAMKLQKLTFYSQVWSLVWDEEPLFDADFEAWANGPVLPSLYRVHRGKFKVKAIDIEGDENALTDTQKDSINKVIEFYGDKTAQWLSNLTHQEAPWLDARKDAGVEPMEASDAIISKAAMEEYYSAL